MQLDNIPEVASRQIERIAEVCERIKPLVVIRCITYNHEAFLKDALDGFLMQKTDFPFVAVVHDDASTDGTAAVLREYAERYPDIILPIFEEENQYSKHDRTIVRVMKAACEATGAKYIAWCEGDDYWIDPKKLQKQVTALENDPDANACYTGFQTVNESGEDVFRKFSIECEAKSRSGDLFKELIKSNYIQTCTFVARKRVIESELYKNSPNNIDYSIFLTASYNGALLYIKEKTASYRINSNGLTNTQLNRIGDWCRELQIYFWNRAIIDRDFIIKDPTIVKYLWNAEWHEKHRNHFHTIMRLFKIAPSTTFFSAIIWLFDYLKRRLKRE